MHAHFTAWQITNYGAPEVMVPVTRPIPTPQKNEVLIRIHTSAVTRADGMMRAGTPRFARLFLGLRRPRNDLVGTGFSGEVIAVGPDVTRFTLGEAVFGEAGTQFGANASHICHSQEGVILPKPATLPHDQAATLCDGVLTSWNFLHHVAQLRAGERVLILGASGSLGSAAVQIAHDIGADVTGTCSAKNAGMVAALGAAHVVDYTREDALDQAAQFDVIYDTLGVSSYANAKHALTAQGRYVCPVLSLPLVGAMLRTSCFGARKARFSATGLLPPDKLRQMLDAILSSIDAGLLAPVMSRSYPLSDLIDAHRHMEAGHKRGNVVVVTDDS
ncbi:NAD(P)-dependent alcohol dehydrogenase [Aliiroseovarius lamellibrachiae]|uniref:NAD(P)-dependent alcohol dehydrogenase n=1 Tax=Aliiroseovarius lamellibrachiae TaxID=1924933 RepID=UPI001BE0CD4A|nr:NAD(P)-dependent alcohol dehydrogenase [Aliiroseovarius lamellibrachiae]MBT2130176.1 NAD(P)-dependent alcohol dehydrogenase [Aliiroseovarius lamellibrachiae]